MSSWTDRLHQLPRDARDTLFVLLLIGWIVLPHVAQLPPWCTALVAIVLIWRAVLAVQGRSLPSRWWLLGLLLLAVAATRSTHSALLGPEAGVTLLVTLLALKTLELRARRDALVIFFLGFFIMLTGFFESQSLPRATATLIGLLGLLTALVNAHRPVGQPSLRESAAIAARLTLIGTPVMIALFIFFPRFAPLWSVPTDGLTGRSGLSSSMTVGNVAELALDDRIAMRLRFEGPPPLPHQLYFRGPVLSRFDGQQWTAWGGGHGFESFAGPPPDDLQVQGEAIRYEVTLEPSDRPWLLTLDATAAAPALPERWQTRQVASLQWLSTRPISERLRYQAESYPEFRYGQDHPDRRPHTTLGQALQLPADHNPRTLDLARQLRREAGDDRAIVEAALQRLRTGGYVYTLEPGVAGRDSADEFWFDTRAGFCEHIASAFVILLRGAEVPARIVTGFQGGEINSVDGYWTVRNADAHAWAEVWLQGSGWTRIDPTGAVMPGRIGQYQRLRTPSGVVATAIGRFNPTLLVRLRARWEAIDNRWNQWILAYTEERQFDLLRGLGFSQPSWQDLGKVLAALLATATMVMALWTRLERRRQDPWLRLLAQVRQNLRRAGLEVADQATPGQLARQLIDSQLPAPFRRQLAAWLLALERQRYAPEQQQARQALVTLRRQLQQMPWPRSA